MQLEEVQSLRTAFSPACRLDLKQQQPAVVSFALVSLVVAFGRE